MDIASRLVPQRSDTTWFSNGRAAFAWIMQHHGTPRRLHLPTYICWSLVNVMRTRFPQTELRFYPVDRFLTPCFPNDVGENDALLFVHYFGRVSEVPAVLNGYRLLEDCSHVPASFVPVSQGTAFGSLRKVYRVADGGFLRGRFNPLYEPTRKLDAWLRCEATDWRDLREAENMTDRDAPIADIASQSLSVVLTADDAAIAEQRRSNQSLLARELSVGRPMTTFAPTECPLLHNRFMEDARERDSLRAYLAESRIYCSIHWPLHPCVVDVQDRVDISEAQWIEDHVISIPVSQDYGSDDMERICQACAEWQRAGGTRFTAA